MLKIKNKKFIIYITLVFIFLFIIYFVFVSNIFNTKKTYELTKYDELEDMKISMVIDTADGAEIIKTVPSTGYWEIEYQCDNANTKVYWDTFRYKLLIDTYSSDECFIRFKGEDNSLKIVSMYVDGDYVDEINPNSEYELEDFSCLNGESVNWDNNTNSVHVTPLNKNTVCKIFLRRVYGWYDDATNPNRLVHRVITDNNGGIADRVIDFKYNSAGCNVATGCTPLASQITNGLYFTTDKTTYGEDGKRVYYYRGRVDNNWVDFAGYKWRIIRTTSTGGVKLIYSGDASTNASGFINTSSYFNSSADSEFHVGYTYASDLSAYETNNQVNSTIKELIDTWYTSANGIQSYNSYLDETAIFCNDKTNYTTSGVIIYSGASRLFRNAERHPSFHCPTANASRYTVNSDAGNGYLTYAIALLTGDEVYYAGYQYTSLAGEYTGQALPYLADNARNGSTYTWTMTPHYFRNSVSSAWIVGHLATLHVSNANVKRGVRPVIALKSCVTVTEGDGSFSTPYQLSNSEC